MTQVFSATLLALWKPTTLSDLSCKNTSIDHRKGKARHESEKQKIEKPLNSNLPLI